MRPWLSCVVLVGWLTLAGCGDERGPVFSTVSDVHSDQRRKEIQAEIAALADSKDPNDVDKDVAADQAKEKLIRRGTAIEPQLIEALGGAEDWGIRLGVIEVLEAVGTRASIDALIVATGDPRPLVALKANKLLEVMCRHREIPAPGEPSASDDLPAFEEPPATDLALDAREKRWAEWHGAHREALRKAWSAWWATNKSTAKID